MEYFFKKLNEEVIKGHVGPLPKVNGKEDMNFLEILYLSLYAGNRNFSGEYVSVPEVKKYNIGIEADTMTIQIPTNISRNDKVVLFKQDVWDYLPEFDFDKYQEKEKQKIREMVQEKKITIFSTNTFDPSQVLNKIAIFPFDNISYKKEEVIPMESVLQIKKEKTSQELVSWKIDRNILEKYIQNQEWMKVFSYVEEITKTEKNEHKLKR
ncbi:hypothetical protein ACILDT_10870 [Capnocytophaga canis]|uniref:hypothetical protein n=1 Tax=Capnocytophaga canis TaxID=1848903 RepID=UPI0037D005FF